MLADSIVVALIGEGEHTKREFLFSSRKPNKKLCEGEFGRSMEAEDVEDTLWECCCEYMKDETEDADEESNIELNWLVGVGWLVEAVLLTCWFPK